ncbi:MAG: bile acid:sodium symporter family protein [Verrucomicrobiota bacterium]
MKKHLGDFWFIYGLFSVIGLAALLPQWGAPGGWLISSVTTKLGVFVIFFMQGLLLPTEELARGLKLWRLHTFIQAMIFIVGPGLAALLAWPLRETLGESLWIGFLFLAILPCTISTSVVFTTQVGGNVAVALFNTSLANIAGIVIVPSFCAWLIETSGEPMPLLPLIGEIVLLLLVPLLIGQVLRFLAPVAKNWAVARQPFISRMNSGIVLFIVYCAFCGSFQSQFWKLVDGQVLLLTVGLTLVLLMALKVMLFLALRVAKVAYPESVAVFFCGCQKTVAAGVPMAQGIFALSAYDVGLILLPLMCYAPLQFTLGGIIVGLLEKKASRSLA